MLTAAMPGLASASDADEPTIPVFVDPPATMTRTGADERTQATTDDTSLRPLQISSSNTPPSGLETTDHGQQQPCPPASSDDCGGLGPRIASISFDPEAFRADPTTNPRFIERIEPGRNHFLPDPDRTLSSLHSLDLLLSRDENEDFQSLSDHSIISRGKSRLVTALDTNSTRGFSLETLRFEHDRKKWTLALGTMDFSGLASPLVTTPAFAGLRAARTLKMRSNSRLLHSSPIFVYLEERSRVDIFRDGKLLSSRFYDAGNRQLDTSTLPDGAYDIELRISNSRGKRSERHLFTRSLLIPPPDHALHFVETGKILKARGNDETKPFPTSTETTVFHAGSRFRIRDNIGGEAEIIGIDHFEDSVQGGLYYFLPKFSLHGGLLRGNEHSNGHYLVADYRRATFNLSLNRQVLRSDDSGQAEHPLLTPNRSTGLALGTTLAGSTLVARASRGHKPGEAVGNTYSLKASRTLYRHGPTSLRLTADWNRDDSDERILFSLQYSANEKRQQKTLTTNWAEGPKPEENGVQLDARLTNLMPGGTGNRGKSVVFAKSSPLGQHIGARLERDFPHASGFVETRIIEQEDSQQAIYSAGAHVTLSTASSSLALSGRKSGLAGLVVDLGHRGEAVDIEIDDRSITPPTASGSALLLLEPYREYRIAIRPRGDRLMRIRTARQRVTLYPGNVARVEWQAEPTFVVVGQAVLPDDSAVSNSRITNLPEFAATDESGRFQVELASMQVLELKRANGRKCRIDLPHRQPDPQEPVIVFSRLVCRPASGAPQGTLPTAAGQ